jgi:hypothetical protein
MILTAAGVIGWMYFYQEFKIIRCEANWAYSESVKIHNQEDDAQEVGDRLSPSTSKEVSLEGNGEPKNSPTPSDNSIEKIIPIIHRLESSGGINDSCLQYGKVNGYGFGIYKGHFRCYETRQEVEKEVADWFKDNLNRYTLSQSVCRYNTGQASDSCPYWEKFKSLDS